VVADRGVELRAPERVRTTALSGCKECWVSPNSQTYRGATCPQRADRGQATIAGASARCNGSASPQNAEPKASRSFRACGWRRRYSDDGSVPAVRGHHEEWPQIIRSELRVALCAPAGMGPRSVVSPALIPRPTPLLRRGCALSRRPVLLPVLLPDRAKLAATVHHRPSWSNLRTAGRRHNLGLSNTC